MNNTERRTSQRKVVAPAAPKLPTGEMRTESSFYFPIELPARQSSSSPSSSSSWVGRNGASRCYTVWSCRWEWMGNCVVKALPDASLVRQHGDGEVGHRSCVIPLHATIAVSRRRSLQVQVDDINYLHTSNRMHCIRNFPNTHRNGRFFFIGFWRSALPTAVGYVP